MCCSISVLVLVILVSVSNCKPRGEGVKSLLRQKFVAGLSAPFVPHTTASSYIMVTTYNNHTLLVER